VKTETVNSFSWCYKDRLQREKIAHIYKDLQTKNIAWQLVQVFSAKWKIQTINFRNHSPMEICNLHLCCFIHCSHK